MKVRYIILTSIITIISFLMVARAGLAWFPSDGQGGP